MTWCEANNSPSSGAKESRSGGIMVSGRRENSETTFPVSLLPSQSCLRLSGFEHESSGQDPTHSRVWYGTVFEVAWLIQN
jgi:hypothetical protein